MVASSPTIKIHTIEDAAGMRKAGRMAAKVLDYITPFVREGVTTLALDTLCHQFILDHGAVPILKGYHGYPNSICTSVNHVVCHGIPGNYALRKGDILNIDVTVTVDGWHGDTSRMFYIPPILPRVAHLLKITKEALDLAISVVKPGARFGDIGAVIQGHAGANGFSVVQDFCGHGIGKVLHDEPQVLHTGLQGTGPILKEGYFFTIEPMINIGTSHTKILKDGWTAVTRDGKYSAQMEHTLGVTAKGYEIFTLSEA